MLLSNPVTAEAVVRHDGTDTSPAREIVAEGFITPCGEPLRILGADGEWTPPVQPGWWVVQFGPGDYAAMTDKERRRLFGDPELSSD